MSEKGNSHDPFCPEKYYSKDACKFCELITAVRNDSRGGIHDSWMEGYEKGYANAMRDVRISRGEI